MRGRLASILAAVGFAFGTAAAPGVATALQLGGPAIPQRAVHSPKTRRESRTKSPPASCVAVASGPGWTQAQVQRMARKKRNRARNKRAHR